jgi:hypothetical protein
MSHKHRNSPSSAEPIEGLIVYEGVTGSKGVHRLVDRRIRQWIAARAGATLDRLRYFVRFTRERDAHRVACEIEIDTGRERWRGQFYGREAQQTFMQALRHAIHLTLPQSPGDARAGVLRPAWAAAGAGPP